MEHRLVVFTDLDGCLLNKSDYDYSAAKSTLERLKVNNIPLVLCSSKTQAEMKPLAVELGILPAPMTCENGGVIVWGMGEDDSIPGAERPVILSVLDTLKSDFAFQSFADLGVEGVMKETDLPRVRAEAACQRQCTEPLLWNDRVERIGDFRTRLSAENLTLTEGGRFWHVAAPVTKGDAMKQVATYFRSREVDDVMWVTVAVGDSPIDQSMLDEADIPVGIPQPDGQLKVNITGPDGVTVSIDGSAGWAEAVGIVLNRLGIPR